MGSGAREAVPVTGLAHPPVFGAVAVDAGLGPRGARGRSCRRRDALGAVQSQRGVGHHRVALGMGPCAVAATVEDGPRAVAGQLDERGGYQDETSTAFEPAVTLVVNFSTSSRASASSSLPYFVFSAMAFSIASIEAFACWT